jgi:glycosyltransferase involved in cell wall biosynthesis
LLVNRDEARLLQENADRDRVAVLPLAIPGRDAGLPPRSYQSRPDFVFMGALNVPHNQCSIEYFIDSAFRDCLVRMPEMKLRVIGPAPSDHLRNLFARYTKSIEWIGWVGDLSAIFAESAAMIVPLLFGSGVKIKTLEAMQHGLPVISTGFGVEGIVSGTQSAGIIVENDLRRFPLHMETLLDRQTNDRYSREAREYYGANCSAHAVADRYRAIFGV